MTRADRLLILLVLIALPLLYWKLWTGGLHANYLLIHSSNAPSQTELLSQQRIFEVSGPLGNSTIEINNGRTRFVSSPCTTKSCIHTGWLSRTGEIAACLPNRISLTLVGRHPDFDAINF